MRPKPGYENKFNETDLRTIQDWIVRRQLLGVKGVAEVSSFGGKLKLYSIEINPDKLLSYNITISDVFKALESNNQNTGGAYIEKGPAVLYIRSEGLIGNTEDIKTLLLKRRVAEHHFYTGCSRYKNWQRYKIWRNVLQRQWGSGGRSGDDAERSKQQ